MTDQELIIVKDDNSLKMAQHARYGGIWRYISLHKVLKVAVESDVENNLLKLTILLPEGVSLSSLFSVSQKAELTLLWDGIEKSRLITERQCV